MGASGAVRLSNVGLVVLVLLALPACVRDAKLTSQDRIGDVYEIRMVRMSETTGNWSFGRSSCDFTAVERVVGTPADGLILEFDLPPDTTPQQRLRQWQFPARVLRRSDGAMELLNAQELEARSADWLERYDFDASACRHGVTSWTAGRIACEPRSVLAAIEQIDLRPDGLADGAHYTERGALEPAALSAQTLATGGQVFRAELLLDPDGVRREQAQSVLNLAEMMGEETPSLEDALSAQSGDMHSGLITVAITTDPQARVIRLERTTRVESRYEGGMTETTETTEVFTRTLRP